MIDISDVSRLKQRDGKKVLQAHKGETDIAYENEYGVWLSVNGEGFFHRHDIETDFDLIYTPPDPWESVKLPESIRLKLYTNGVVVTNSIVVSAPSNIYPSFVSERRFRLVPMEGEE